MCMWLITLKGGTEVALLFINKFLPFFFLLFSPYHLFHFSSSLLLLPFFYLTVDYTIICFFLPNCKDEGVKNHSVSFLQESVCRKFALCVHLTPLVFQTWWFLSWRPSHLMTFLPTDSFLHFSPRIFLRSWPLKRSASCRRLSLLRRHRGLVWGLEPLCFSFCQAQGK